MSGKRYSAKAVFIFQMACKLVLLGLVVTGWAVYWKVGKTILDRGINEVINDGYAAARECLPVFLIKCTKSYATCKTIISHIWVILAWSMEIYKYISELGMLSYASCIFWMGLYVRRECQQTNELSNSVIIKVICIQRYISGTQYFWFINRPRLSCHFQ